MVTFAAHWAGLSSDSSEAALDELGVTPDARARTGDLATDMGHLLVAVCEAAAEARSLLLVEIDEIQKAPAVQLEALLNAVQNVYTRQPAGPVSSLPLSVVGAGLPGSIGVLRERAGTFAERCRFVDVGPLDVGESADALTLPALEQHVSWDQDALGDAVASTAGWPYAVQLVGYQCWAAGTRDAISPRDVERGVAAARRELGFLYNSRIDPLPHSLRSYLVAAASLDAADRTSAAVADVLGMATTEVGSYRVRLIDAGLLRVGSGRRLHFTLPGLRDHVRTQG